MSEEAILLKMAVKAVNDTAGPDGLVPTLLVFGAYPRMTIELRPAPSMVKRSEAIQKATKALRKLTAERQVTDAINARSGPATADMLALPLQSEVLELDIATLTYDLCLLITNSDADVFGIVGMQTDNTIILGTPAFSSLKEKKT
ncbi:hypothetical protein PTT_20027 [Pyrenophora teres f. teres 0-1]|uniref:Uncharacterized protein n=1 Tax=Pyrenophora teres f. teres (strain 0-1) TaxID=861557 RepID=E3SA87_PYRTT|nr:hypothetical protein PTT_20027 [Pyrenophora teres f. teres 0-1]